MMKIDALLFMLFVLAVTFGGFLLSMILTLKKRD